MKVKAAAQLQALKRLESGGLVQEVEEVLKPTQQQQQVQQPQEQQEVVQDVQLAELLREEEDTVGEGVGEAVEVKPEVESVTEAV